MKLLRKFQFHFRNEKLEAEMAEEMRLHVELQTEMNRKAGMKPDEARFAALRQFGNVAGIQEQARAQYGFRWVQDLLRDFRFAFRVFAKSPVMSAVIVASLAAGLGANTAVFSWIHTVAFNPLLGVRDGAGLVIIEELSKAGIQQFASRPEWRDLRAQTKSFTDVCAQSIATFTLDGKTSDARTWGEFVSDNFFPLLGVQPVAGRFFRPVDDEVGGDPVVVISEKLWESRYDRRAGAIGQTLRLNGQSLTIIGVAPRNFQGGYTGLALDVWLPMAHWTQFFVGAPEVENRSLRVLQLIGRLRPGVTLAQATADVNVVLAWLGGQYPDSARGLSGEVVPNWRARTGAQAVVVPTLATLQTVTLLLLLVVCTNTANLLLAQATVRSKEIAIRLSLGAGRGRLIRQLLAESLLLALLGAGCGTLLAFAGIDAINRIPKPSALPIALVGHLERADLLFSVLLAAGCALVFGLAPALQSTRDDLADAMKIGGRSSGATGRRLFQEFLVALEVGLAFVIVVLAGLFLKSFHNARQLDPGFNPKGVLLGSFDLAGHGYDAARTRALEQALLARLEEQPAVRSAAIASWVPLDLVFTLPAEFELEGRARDPDRTDLTHWYEASPGYFRTLEIGLLEGRDFSGFAEQARRPEAVVNEEFVRRYLAPGQPLLGRRLTLRGIAYRIVGVVRTGKYNSLSEVPQPLVYLSLSGRSLFRLTVFVRTAAEPAGAFAAVKQVVHELDPELAFLENRTLEQHLENGLILRVIPAHILAVLGPLALFLAATGLYSVLAYSVAQRTHEIGVRMTLGATARSVVLLILRQGMTAVMAGLLVGLIGAYAASVRLSRDLVQVPPGDPALFVSLPVLLAAVALLACWLPARRAAKVDPMVALRAE